MPYISKNEAAKLNRLRANFKNEQQRLEALKAEEKFKNELREFLGINKDREDSRRSSRSSSIGSLKITQDGMRQARIDINSELIQAHTHAHRYQGLCDVKVH